MQFFPEQSIGRLFIATALLAAFLGTARAQFGTNLILNPGAESAVGGNGAFLSNLPNWTITGQATAVVYGAPGGFPLSTDPGPASRGLNFFEGGDVGSSSASQVVSLAFATAQINAGLVSYDLSAWLGGFSSHDDNAVLTVNFRNASNGILSTSTLGPVLAADRSNATGLLLRSTTGPVPVNTTNALVTLQMTRLIGTSNDGYADNLSLAIVPEPATGLMLAGGGFLLLMRRRRKE